MTAGGSGVGGASGIERPSARRWVWTLDEILALGDEAGFWFYGLVRDEGRLWLAEVFPSTGYARRGPRWWSPREWFTFAHDVAVAKPRLLRADALRGEQR